MKLIKILLVMFCISQNAISEHDVTDWSARPWPQGTEVQMDDAGLLGPVNGAMWWNTDWNLLVSWIDNEWQGIGLRTWQPEQGYPANHVIEFEKILFKSTANHVSDTTFLPDLLLGLWERISYQDQSTGLGGGGVVTINVLDPSTIDVTLGAGQVVDSYTFVWDVVQPVGWGNQTVPVPVGANESFWVWADPGVTPANALIRTELGTPTINDVKTRVVLAEGVLGPLGNAVAVMPRAWLSGNPDSKLMDTTTALGMVNMNGNKYTPVDTDPLPPVMSMDRSAGRIHGFGINPQNSVSPNIFETANATPVNFVYTLSGDVIQPITTILDPLNFQPDPFDQTLVAVGNNRWTIQRIYLSSRGATFIQYGQSESTSRENAIRDFLQEPFIRNPIYSPDRWLLIGYIVMAQSATTCVIDDPLLITDCQIVNCGKFGCGASGTTAGEALGGDVLGPISALDGSFPNFKGTGGNEIEDMETLRIVPEAEDPNPDPADVYRMAMNVAPPEFLFDTFEIRGIQPVRGGNGQPRVSISAVGSNGAEFMDTELKLVRANNNRGNGIFFQDDQFQVQNFWFIGNGAHINNTQSPSFVINTNHVFNPVPVDFPVFELERDGDLHVGEYLNVDVNVANTTLNTIDFNPDPDNIDEPVWTFGNTEITVGELDVATPADIDTAYTLPYTRPARAAPDTTAGYYLRMNETANAVWTPGITAAGYYCNNDTPVVIGANSNQYLNWTNTGCIFQTGNVDVLRGTDTGIVANFTGTVQVTACLRNLGDARRFGLRIQTTNIMETQTVLANSWPCISITRPITRNEEIRVNNPGTGGSTWKRATMSVLWFPSNLNP